MAKYIHNPTQSAKTYQGREIAAESFYAIPQNVEIEFANDSTLITDLANGIIKMSKDGSTDLSGSISAHIDFLKTGATLSTDGIPLTRNTVFADATNFRFRGMAMDGIATKTTTTNIDFKLTEERYLNGGQMIVQNHVIGDYVKFQVIDKDNILGYGTNVILDEFISKWYLRDSNSQPEILLPYPARIIANLYIRIVYVSIGTVNDVNFYCNLYLHKKSV
jgi:hypothetical protein